MNPGGYTLECRIYFRVSKELNSQLNRICGARGLDRSKIAREALVKHLQRVAEEEKKNVSQNQSFS